MDHALVDRSVDHETHAADARTSRAARAEASQFRALAKLDALVGGADALPDPPSDLATRRRARGHRVHDVARVRDREGRVEMALLAADRDGVAPRTAMILDGVVAGRRRAGPASVPGWHPGGLPETRRTASARPICRARRTCSRASPHRDCLLVIKDGELVHEAYYGDARRDARLATDNVGLLAVVALVGAAENQGLVHLDVPIADHGVDVSDVFGPEHGPDITLRHLLAQTHGGGEVSPGTVFRRDDSPAYLDVIARLLENASGRPFPASARLALGEKIGAPNLFDGTTIPGDASGDEDGGRRPPDTAAGRSNAAGYLVRRSRDGQGGAALPQRRAWPDRDGVPRQILSARFVRETFTPAFPQLNQAHGLAAWLHGPVDARRRVLSSGGGDDGVRRIRETARRTHPRSRRRRARETVEAVLVRETVRGEADGDGAGSSRAGGARVETTARRFSSRRNRTSRR